MLLRAKLHGKTYEFPDIRILMGKANEEKSGDQLAGVAAETAAERAAARFVLAEVPLQALRETVTLEPGEVPVVPASTLAAQLDANFFTYRALARALGMLSSIHLILVPEK